MAQPRQDRAIRTRRLLLDAAASVFDEHGFHGSSISQIAQRAGTTPGALYFHFKSKKDLAQAVMNEQAAGLVLPDRPRGLGQLVETMDYLAGQMQRNLLFRAGVTLAVEQKEVGLNDTTAYEMWARRFAAELHTAEADGELLPDVDIEVAAGILVAAYTGTQIISRLTTGRSDLPERIEQLWSFLLPALATSEAVARYAKRPSVSGRRR